MELVRLSLSEQIYAQLKQDIILQRIVCGQKLTMRELQEQYRVSSTPVREALTRLAQEGLVEFTTNQGAKVIELDIQDMLEINDLCALHDSYAVSLAMESPRRKELLADLKESIDEQSSFFRASQKMEENLVYNNAFHANFYNYIANTRLKHLSTQLQGLFAIVTLKAMGDKYPSESIEEHRAVYDAVVAGDSALAAGRMREHFQNGKQRLLAIYHTEGLSGTK